MPYTKENSNYDEFAQMLGVDTGGEPINDAQKDYLYNSIVEEAFKSRQKELTGQGSTNQAIDDVLELFPEGRSALGVPEVVEDQFGGLSINAFQESLKELPDEVLDEPVNLFISDYVSKFKTNDARYSHPELYKLPREALKKRLTDNIQSQGDFNLDRSYDPVSVKQILGFDPNAVVEDQVESDQQREDDPGTVENVTRGLGSSIVDLVGKTVESISSLGNTIASKVGDVRLFDDGKLFNIYSSEEIKQVLAEAETLSPDIIGQLGNSIQDVSDSIAEGADQDSLAFKIGDVGGQLSGFALSATAGVRAFAAARAGATAILSGGEYQLDDYEETLLAEGEKFNVEDADNVALWGAAIGSLESIPAVNLFKRVTGNTSTPKLLKWLDDTSNGRLVTALKRGTTGAFEEGIQEVVSNTAQNLVASNIVKYDEDRQLWEGAQESGEIGAAAGGFLNALAGFVSGRRKTRSSVEGVQPVDGTGTQVGDRPDPDEEIVQTTAVDEPELVNEVDVATANPATRSATVAEPEITSTFNTEDIRASRIRSSDGQEQVVVRQNNRIAVAPTEQEAILSLRDQQQQEPPPAEPQAQPQGEPVLGTSTLVVEKENIAENVALPVTLQGAFEKDRTTPGGVFVPGAETILENAGFVILPSSKDNKTAFTTLKLYKNGAIYTVAKPKKRDKSGAVRIETKIQSVDGTKLDPASTSTNAVQEIRNQSGVRASRSYTLPSAVSGVRIDQTIRDGNVEQTLLSTDGIVKVAERTGGRVEINEPNLAAIRYGSDIVSFIVEGNSVIVEKDGEAKIFNDGYINLNQESKQSISLLTEQLLQQDYKLVDANENEVKLRSSQDEEITITNQDGKTRVVREQDGEVIDDTILTSVNNSVSRINDTPVVEEDVSVPDNALDAQAKLNVEDSNESTNSNAKQQRTLRDYSDGGLSDYAVDENGDAVIDNGDDRPSVVFKTKGRDQAEIENTIRLTNVQTFSASVNEDVNKDKGEKPDKARIDALIDMFPQHIRDLVNVHYQNNRTNPVHRFNDVLGYFDYSGNVGPNERRGPSIQVDGSDKYGLSHHDVIDTIAEEVGHFSFDSFTLKPLTELYDIAYDLVKDAAIPSLKAYISRNSIDVNNPTPSAKHIIVNEFFSKQGTSIIDFASDQIGLPPGITNERLQKIKRDVIGKVEEIKIDLTKNYQGDTQEATDFIEKMLRAQSAGIHSKAVVMEYRTNFLPNQKAKINIITTPFGSQVIKRPETALNDRITSLKNRFDRAETPKERRRIYWTESNVKAFSNTPLGRELTLLINNAHQNLSQNYIQILRKHNSNYLRAKVLLDSKLYGAVSKGDSYRKIFKQLGLTRKKHLELASEIDLFRKDAEKLKYQNVALIHRAFDEANKMLTQLGLADRVPETLISKYRAELKAQRDRYVTDWDHTRYDAHTPEGLQTLIDMRRIVAPGTSVLDKDFKTLEESVNTAQKNVSKLAKKVESGNQLSRSEFKEYEDATHTLDINTRLLALAQWSSENLPRGRRTATNIRTEMESQLSYLIKENENLGGLNRFQRLELVDAAKRVILDPNDVHDQKQMVFMGRITDDVRVALYNLEAQNQVLSTLEFNNKVAKHIVKNGIGWIKGSTISGRGDDSIATLQAGSLLKYIEVDNDLAPFLEDDIRIQQEIQDVELNRILGQIKQNLTVFNPKVALGNYASNAGVQVMTGHAFYFTKLFGETAMVNGDINYRKTVADSYNQRMTWTLDKNGNIGNEIVQELNDSGLLGAGFTSLTLDISKSGLIDDLVGSLGDVANKASLGQLGNDKVELWRNLTENFFDSVRKFYAFGDDWAKVMPYIVNREIGVARAQTLISRNDFLQDSFGEQEYREAIRDSAVEYAISKTQSETVTWADSPSWVRNRLRDKVRLFYGDFMMHGAQMLKIEINNVLNLTQEYKELKRLSSEGLKDTSYYRSLRTRFATRFVGNAFNYTAKGMFFAGAPPLTYMVIHGAASLFVDLDDEDTPYDERGYLSTEQFNAVQRLLTHTQFKNSPLLSPLPFGRQGDLILANSTQRYDASNTWIIYKPDNNLSVEENVVNYIDQLLSVMSPISLAQGGDGATIAGRLYNALVGNRDDFGNEIGDAVDRLKYVADLGIPGAGLLAKDLYQSTEELIVEGNELPIIKTLSKLIGTTVIAKDVRDIAYSKGFEIKKERSNGIARRDFFDRLTTGEDLEEAEVVEIVQKHISDARRLQSTIDDFTDNLRAFGWDQNKIIEHLQKDTTGKNNKLGQTNAERIAAGDNIYMVTMPDSIGRRIDALSKLTPSKTKLTPRSKENQLKALELARQEYEKVLKTNKW